jgi:hypothetical protein
MSIKPHNHQLTIIVRTKESSKCMDLIENESNSIDYVYLSKQLYPDLQINHFENCSNLKVRDFLCYIEKYILKNFI